MSIREAQKQHPKFETFVPKDVKILYDTIREEQNFLGVEEFNSWMYKNKPNVPRSTVRRWTKAYVNGKAHQETPSWHVRYKEDASIVPDKYSDIRNGNYNRMIDDLKKQGVVRYANVSCMHRPEGDGALLDLMLEIVKEFKPNVFPYYSDSLDSNSFNMHKPQPHTARERILNEEVHKERKNKYHEFVHLLGDTDDMLSSVLPSDCYKINVWGNHENRILRYLLDRAAMTGDDDYAEVVMDMVFDEMQKRGVLWTEMDRRQFLPMSKNFWIGHGDRSRGGTMGTAKAYLEQTKYAVSIAVGHTHRQEVFWEKQPYSEVFACVAGTLGVLQEGYAKQAFRRHNWGFQLITHPYGETRGSVVEDVRINFKDGFYVTNWRGKEYSQRATVSYDELLDFV